MIRTQIQLDKEQMEWLRAEARERGISVSQLIRESVNHFRVSEEQVPEDKKRKALAAIGRFSSGKSDVSERHDAYLTNAFRNEGGHGK